MIVSCAVNKNIFISYNYYYILNFAHPHTFNYYLTYTHAHSHILCGDFAGYKSLPLTLTSQPKP